MTPVTPPTATKTKLLDAALSLIRTKGYSATTVDDLCRAAGVTKGAFFHHFASKEALALAAADHFSARSNAGFAAAPYQAQGDPVLQLLEYVDFRKTILQGELPEFTCLFGTMVQEAYQTHPAIREAANRGISGHAADIEAIIARAMNACGIKGPWSAESLSLHIQAVLQGAFILAKAKGGPAVAAQCLDHLRRYLELLFVQPSSQPVN
jgi:TetR/AcrR family transcriptional regulator, transcriptional repressor for nem operon